MNTCVARFVRRRLEEQIDVLTKKKESLATGGEEEAADGEGMEGIEGGEDEEGTGLQEEQM